MTFRDMHLAVFRRQPYPGVLWQPRIEHWYDTNKRQGTLPERYRDMSMLEVFDDLGCSVRAYWVFNFCYHYADCDAVRYEEQVDGSIVTTTTHTPVGDLVTVNHRTEAAWHTQKYPVETPDDMRIVEWIMAHRTVTFSPDAYAKACADIGDRGAPTTFIPRINVMRVIVEFMGFENGLTGFYQYPDEMEHLIRTINETDDIMLKTICESPIEIINFGDNIHQTLCPPPLFEQYVLPEYQRRNEILHKAGKKTYSHWDGDCGQLLRYARDCGFDGIEAITPVPQGDVTLEQVRDALGDLIMIDGIPCTDFLPSEPVESLIENTRKCIEYFGPNLVLGISDEISPVGDIERVRMVSEICAEYAR